MSSFHKKGKVHNDAVSYATALVISTLPSPSDQATKKEKVLASQERPKKKKHSVELVSPPILIEVVAEEVRALLSGVQYIARISISEINRRIREWIDMGWAIFSNEEKTMIRLTEKGLPFINSMASKFA